MKEYILSKNSLGFICFIIISTMALCGIELSSGAVDPERDPITMLVTVVNPSPDKTQKIPVKVYLPQELIPKDVLSAGGLDIKYDEEKSLFYVFKEEVELQPHQVQTYEVKVKDLWVIPQKPLNSLREKTKKTLKLFEKTPYYDPARKLVDTIYMALDTIESTQNDNATSSKQHIAVYRNNLKIFEQIEDNLKTLEKQAMLVKMEPVSPKAPEPALKPE